MPNTPAAPSGREAAGFLLALLRCYSDTTLSAAAVFSAKTFGVMNWAFLVLRSTSVTPRATEHFPQTKIGTL